MLDMLHLVQHYARVLKNTTRLYCLTKSTSLLSSTYENLEKKYFIKIQTLAKEHAFMDKSLVLATPEVGKAIHDSKSLKFLKVVTSF